MPSVSNFQTALEGVLLTQISAAATTATVKVKEINGVTPTWLTTAHRITIIQKSRTVTKVEVIDVAAGTSQSSSTVTLGTMTRGLPLDGTGFTGTGTAQVFTSGARVIVTWDAQAGRQTAFKDVSNTFTTHQLISSTNELRFADSATAVWDDGTDLNFKSSAQATRTLTQLASLSGANDKVKISVDDTTENYLASKLTGGDGITVTETNGGGNETLDIDVELATDPGLEINSGGLRVKASTGITRDSNGISVNQSALTSVPVTNKTFLASGANSAALSNPTSNTAFTVHTFNISANDLVAGVGYEFEAAIDITWAEGEVIPVIMLGSTEIVASTVVPTASGKCVLKGFIMGTAAAGASVAVRGCLSTVYSAAASTKAGSGYASTNAATNGALAFQFGIRFGTSNGAHAATMVMSRVSKISASAF